MNEISSDELQHQCELIEEYNDPLDDVHATELDGNIATIRAELTEDVEFHMAEYGFPFKLGGWTHHGFARTYPSGEVEFNVSKEELHE